MEGIAPRPVSGLDIELLSVLVNHRENWQTMPPQCKLQFYLPDAAEVDWLRVQELSPRHFYKMEPMVTKQAWQPGDINDYEWPTTEVIQPLGLKIAQLGVVARLKKMDYSQTEPVAPVALYHATPPTTIPGYLFAFKVGGNAKLKYAIYQGNSQTPLITEPIGKQWVGKPFVIAWNSAQATEGSYELVVEGYFLDNYMPIYQGVQFYHNPVINRKN